MHYSLKLCLIWRFDEDDDDDDKICRSCASGIYFYRVGKVDTMHCRSVSSLLNCELGCSVLAASLPAFGWRSITKIIHHSTFDTRLYVTVAVSNIKIL